METNRNAQFSRHSRAGASARIPLLASLAGAAIVGLAAGPASAAPPGGLRVSVQAPAGKGCISADKLKSAVQRHTKGPARSAAVDVQIEGADSGPGWVADVAVAGRAGHRTVRTQSASCSKLDEGLVLVVTLLVDPDEDDEPAPPAAPPPGKADSDSAGDGEQVSEGGSSWGKDEPDEDEPDDTEPAADKKPGAAKGDSPNQAEPEGGSSGKQGKGDKGASGKGSANKGSANKDSSDKEPGSHGSGKNGGKGSEYKTRFAFSAAAVYALGLLPGAAPGARVAVSWMPHPYFSLEGAFTYYAPFFESVSDMTSGAVTAERHVETHVAEIDTCPARLDLDHLHFAACAGVSLTHYHMQVQEQPEPGIEDPSMYGVYYSTDDWMVSPLADLRFDVSPFSWARAGVAVQAQAPIADRPGSAPSAGGGQILGALADPVIFQARAGITVVLPP